MKTLPITITENNYQKTFEIQVPTDWSEISYSKYLKLSKSKNDFRTFRMLCNIPEWLDDDTDASDYDWSDALGNETIFFTTPIVQMDEIQWNGFVCADTLDKLTLNDIHILDDQCHALLNDNLWQGIAAILLRKPDEWPGSSYDESKILLSEATISHRAETIMMDVPTDVYLNVYDRYLKWRKKLAMDFPALFDKKNAQRELTEFEKNVGWLRIAEYLSDGNNNNKLKVQNWPARQAIYQYIISIKTDNERKNRENESIKKNKYR